MRAEGAIATASLSLSVGSCCLRDQLPPLPPPQRSLCHHNRIRREGEATIPTYLCPRVLVRSA